MYDGTAGARVATASWVTLVSSGKLIAAEVDADSDAERQRIELRLGDSLALTVTSREPGLVEVVGLGLTEDVDPDEPAVFDLRPDERGSYPVRLIAPNRAGVLNTKWLNEIEVLA